MVVICLYHKTIDPSQILFIRIKQLNGSAVTYLFLVFLLPRKVIKKKAYHFSRFNFSQICTMSSKLVISIYLCDYSRFGTWPVAMLAQSKNKAILEGPVCNGSQVIGWHTNEKSKRLRRFHVDMSGFAFNSTILWDPKRWQRRISDPIRQRDTVKEGFQVLIIPF